ncbi:unnamed protein product [Amoebophrya sp. A120]|nr:unnamed protein product [Amoebophrya sp. A120]|eukprot:GSA120T00002333001.1
MPFACVIEAQHLAMVLKGLEGLSNTVVITVKEEEGMFGHAQDDALVALCDWKISFDGFSHFEFFRTAKTCISWKLDVRWLLKMIAGAEAGNHIEIYSNDNPTFLGLSYIETSAGKRKTSEEFNAKLPLLKITEDDRMKVSNVPSEYYDNQVRMNSKTLLYMVNALQTQAANVRISVDPQIFRCSIESRETGVSTHLSIPQKNDTMTNKEHWVDLSGMRRSFEQRFPLKFLQTFTSCANQVGRVDLFFRQNHPIIVRYFLGESQKNGYLSFFTSPLLQNDGTRDEDVAPGL